MYGSYLCLNSFFKCALLQHVCIKKITTKQLTKGKENDDKKKVITKTISVIILRVCFTTCASPRRLPSITQLPLKNYYYTARYWFLMLKLIIVNLNARISLEIVFIAHPCKPIRYYLLLTLLILLFFNVYDYNNNLIVVILRTCSSGYFLQLWLQIATRIVYV